MLEAPKPALASKRKLEALTFMRSAWLSKMDPAVEVRETSALVVIPATRTSADVSTTTSPSKAVMLESVAIVRPPSKEDTSIVPVPAVCAVTEEASDTPLVPISVMLPLPELTSAFKASAPAASSRMLPLPSAATTLPSESPSSRVMDPLALRTIDPLDPLCRSDRAPSAIGVVVASAPTLSVVTPTELTVMSSDSDKKIPPVLASAERVQRPRLSVDRFQFQWLVQHLGGVRSQIDSAMLQVL